MTEEWDWQDDGPPEEPQHPDPGSLKWDYEPIFSKIEHKKTIPIWPGVREAYYAASKVLISGITKRTLNEHREGITAAFLFRHYLELSLKMLILCGRRLKDKQTNAAWNEIEDVRKTHNLNDLWAMVLDEAKPKTEPKDWNRYDMAFVKNCVFEFHDVDARNVTFRYDNKSRERYHTINFKNLSNNMEHVHEVFDGLISLLSEAHDRNDPSYSSWNATWDFPWDL